MFSLFVGFYRKGPTLMYDAHRMCMIIVRYFDQAMRKYTHSLFTKFNIFYVLCSKSSSTSLILLSIHSYDSTDNKIRSLPRFILYFLHLNTKTFHTVHFNFLIVIIEVFSVQVFCVKGLFLDRLQ